MGIGVNFGIKDGGIGVKVDVGIGSVGIGISGQGVSGNIGINVGGLGANVGVGPSSASGFTDFGINIAGLKVNISQEGCTVTVEKKIWGNTVELYSYQDPKCKQPEIPIPTPSPSPSPTPSPENDNSTGMEGFDDSQRGYFIFCSKGSKSIYWRNYTDTYKWRTEEYVYSCAGGVVNVTYSASNEQNTYVTYSTTETTSGTALDGSPININRSYYTLNSYVEFQGVYRFDGLRYGLIDPYAGRPLNADTAILALKGTVATVKAQLLTFQTETWSYTDGGRYNGGYKSETLTNKYKLCWSSILPPVKNPPKWNPPPMQEDKCCKEAISMLRKIMKVLDVEEVEKNGFVVQNRFLVAEGSGSSTAKTYTGIYQLILRMMAHGMIFAPKVQIKDSDSAKAGNQGLELKYVNATGWAQGIAEMVYEIMDDGNVSTNMEIRTGFAATQTMVAVVDCVRKLDAVLDALGVQLKQRRELIDTPYDLTFGEKGFNEKTKQLDLKKDEDTEALLPLFLNTRKNPLKTVELHPNADTILEVLLDIKKILTNKGVS